MKILIIGHARHGKDLTAELLCKLDPRLRPPLSSSRVACDLFIFNRLKDKYNYESSEQCWLDRVNHRSEWFDLIYAYNATDPARLAKAILQKSDIYVGLRARAEFEAARHLFDHVIWVDRSKHCPLEGKGSMELTADDATAVVDNNGSVEDLSVGLSKWISGIK